MLFGALVLFSGPCFALCQSQQQSERQPRRDGNNTLQDQHQTVNKNIMPLKSGIEEVEDVDEQEEGARSVIRTEEEASLDVILALVPFQIIQS